MTAAPPLEAVPARDRRAWRDALDESTDPELKPGARFVAWVFHRYANADDSDPHCRRVWVEPVTGQRHTGMSNGAWYRWVGRLEAAGWLRETQPPRKGTNPRAARYQLTIPTANALVPTSGNSAHTHDDHAADTGPCSHQRESGVPTSGSPGFPLVGMTRTHPDETPDTPAARDDSPPAVPEQRQPLPAVAERDSDPYLAAMLTAAAEDQHRRTTTT